MALYSSTTVILALALLHSSVNANALPTNNTRTKRFAVDERLYDDQVTIVADGLAKCVGTLIRPAHVLTARSCILYPNEEFIGNIIVIAGTPDLHAEKLKSRIYGYPHSITVNRGYDLAVLKVDFERDMKPSKFSVTLSNREMRSGDLVAATSLEVDDGQNIVNYRNSDRKNAPFAARLGIEYMPVGNVSFCTKQWGKDFDRFTQMCNAVYKKDYDTPTDALVGGGVFDDNHHLVGVVSYKSSRFGSVAREAAVYTMFSRLYNEIKRNMAFPDNNQYVRTCFYDSIGNIKIQCQADTYKPAPGSGLD